MVFRHGENPPMGGTDPDPEPRGNVSQEDTRAAAQPLLHLIDWELDQAAFRQSVKELIDRARGRGKVLGLPMEIAQGQAFLDIMTVLLAQVKCDNCDARCCKRNPEDLMTGILPPEYQRISEKYGKEHFIMKDGDAFLPFPCPFLKKGRCTIYQDRPLVCVLYPFQPGAYDGDGNPVMAVASSCPEARRLARDIYMMGWRIRRQFSMLGEIDFMKGVFQR